jgi:hypothetical protein
MLEGAFPVGPIWWLLRMSVRSVVANIPGNAWSVIPFTRSLIDVSLGRDYECRTDEALI